MADRSSGEWEDLEITKDEVRNITEALKKEEFRKLLVDYVEEVNDPENRKNYQEEITFLEKERGYDVAFINPEPGYVFKTSVDGKKKAFINLCKSDKIQKPTSTRATKSGAKGANWLLPYSLVPPRDDLDKAGKMCVVYDVVFHPEALARNDQQFTNMLIETALDAVESNFDVKLDRKNVKRLKATYKGAVPNAVLRKKSENPPENDIDDDYLRKINYPSPVHDVNIKQKEKSHEGKNRDVRAEQVNDNTPYTIPTYVIKHRSPIDMQEYVNDKSAKLNAAIPKELVIDVDLPLLSSSSDVMLDVTEDSLALQSEKHAKYKLEIKLPYKVYEESGNAKFDKDKRRLNITLPVRRSEDTLLRDIVREDSGVESDMSCQMPESSSGDDDSTENDGQASEGNYSDGSSNLILESSIENDRTNLLSEKPFLDLDKHYLLPSFTCNVFDDVIAFTLHVKNVDPCSLVHHLLKDLCGIAVKFMSIGSGHFPVYYVLCIKFPNGAVFQEECVNIETWDNNVVIQMQVMSCYHMPTEFYVGPDEENLLERHDIPDPSALGKKLGELKESACNESSESSLKAEVVEATESTFVLEIKPDCKELNNASTTVKDDETKEDNLDEDSVPCVDHERQLSLMKSRTYSESSGEDIILSPRKGILKHADRVSRSLSESSVDEYSWSSSMDILGHSGGSDSCIPEEEEGGTEYKKTVRFNDDISRKIYRSNSSILGQRRKNQRKIRNKKRALDRRASESENSEQEFHDDGDIAVVDDHECREDSVLENKEKQQLEAEYNPEPSTSALHFGNKSNSISEPRVTKDRHSVSQLQLENDLISQLSI